MEDNDKKIWEMLDILDEVEPPSDFEVKLFKRIEEIEAKKSTFIEKIRRLIFIPVPAAAIIGLLLGIILGNITRKADITGVSVKEQGIILKHRNFNNLGQSTKGQSQSLIILNLDSFSNFHSNGLTHSYISMLKEVGGGK